MTEKDSEKSSSAENEGSSALVTEQSRGLCKSGRPWKPVKERYRNTFSFTILIFIASNL